MTTPLDQRLKAVKWGEFKLGKLFEILSYKKRFDANKVKVLESGGHPYIVRMGGNNGQKGYIDEDKQYLNDGNTISFGQDTATMFYQEKPYFTGDKIKILSPKLKQFSKANAQFFLATMRRTFSNFSWGTSSFNVEILANQPIALPVTDSGSIDFAFMESFMRELEEERMRELSAYLTISGLDNCELSIVERSALDGIGTMQWQEFNIKALFGSSTRGKRLKGDDRVLGTMPFVTAGEAETGVSAFIGNQVDVFERNTTTIDMFGSAKYRNYKYGADDHVAVVHTEKLPKHAAVFVTAACHKAAHTGAFDYGRNFYAKDADALSIMLPALPDGTPDYATMEVFMRAVQKLVVRDVVAWKDREIAATRQVVDTVVTVAKPSRILPDVASSLRFSEYLPFYSLSAACGKFGEGEAVECEGWVKVDGLELDESLFVVQACGRSMEPKIHDGDLCIMRTASAGTRQGKIVLAQHHAASDPDTGGAYSIKLYSSEKRMMADGGWHHERITLLPLNSDFSPIVLEEGDGDFSIVAELVQVLHNGDDK